MAGLRRAPSIAPRRCYCAWRSLPAPASKTITELPARGRALGVDLVAGQPSALVPDTATARACEEARAVPLLPVLAA